jgi:hypothetical protein
VAGPRPCRSTGTRPDGAVHMVRSECGPHLLLHHGRIVAVKLTPWQRKPSDLERVGSASSGAKSSIGPPRPA